MTTGRSRFLGPDSRPVAVPEDVGDPGLVKASGLVQLPVGWSGAARRHGPTTSTIRKRNRVYEIVLREGTEDDVRRFIDVDVLADQWDVLVLPPRVRRAWADWFRRHGITLMC